MDLIIETKDVSKTYRKTEVPVHALKEVSLKVKEGEFTVIVGPSGSGKTTLLNMIGGLDKPSEGQVLVDGEDISDKSGNDLIDFRLNKIGFVFQSYNLIPVLSAEENTEFIMLLQRKGKKERKERVKELLEAVGLGEHLDRKPNELSGGQQQRVAVARALASKPKFVLADEPTASLDTESAENLLDIMARLNKEEGITFIFSTHDQRVVDRARRIITLKDGKIESDEEREKKDKD